MAYLRRKYYYRDKDVSKELSSLYAGFDILNDHPPFSQLKGEIFPKASHLNGKGAFCCVTKGGEIFSNIASGLDANEWAYALAHSLLHLAFGHFDKDRMPQEAKVYPGVWNKACDIYVTRFLADIGFGKPLFPDPATKYSIRLNDEIKIYDYLLKTEGTMPKQSLGLNTTEALDMIGLSAPIFYKKGEKNEYAEALAQIFMSII